MGSQRCRKPDRCHGAPAERKSYIIHTRDGWMDDGWMLDGAGWGCSDCIKIAVTLAGTLRHRWLIQSCKLVFISVKKKKKGCWCSILVIAEDRFCLMKAKNEDLRNKRSPEITNRFKKHVYVLTYFWINFFFWWNRPLNSSSLCLSFPYLDPCLLRNVINLALTHRVIPGAICLVA